MASRVQERERVERAPERVSMVHTYCDCSPMLATCGTPMRTPPASGDFVRSIDCVVCDAMLADPCPGCGR